jgi:hypothetical protein
MISLDAYVFWFLWLATVAATATATRYVIRNIIDQSFPPGELESLDYRALQQMRSLYYRDDRRSRAIEKEATRREVDRIRDEALSRMLDPTGRAKR